MLLNFANLPVCSPPWKTNLQTPIYSAFIIKLPDPAASLPDCLFWLLRNILCWFWELIPDFVLTLDSYSYMQTRWVITGHYKLEFELSTSWIPVTLSGNANPQDQRFLRISSVQGEKKSLMCGRTPCDMLKDAEDMSRFGLEVELEQFKSILHLSADYSVEGNPMPFSWWQPSL